MLSDPENTSHNKLVEDLLKDNVFDPLEDKVIEELANNDPKKMVQYMDADERSRKEMESRHYSGSGAIQQLAEMQQALGKSTQWFYESLREVAMFSYMNRDISPDQLTAFITELGEKD